MKKKTAVVPVTSTPMWEKLESFVRARVQETVQSILEEEVTTMLGRGRSERRRDAFAKAWRRTHPKAVAILERDWERMVAFFDLPREHWKHLRTTNVVESPFAAVRLRTDAAKRFKKTADATSMIWRLLLVAEKRFRKIDAPHLAAAVHRGEKFVDGVKLTRSNQRAAA